MGPGKYYERNRGNKLGGIETGRQCGSRAAVNWTLSALISSPLMVSAGSASGKSIHPQYLRQRGPLRQPWDAQPMTPALVFSS